MDSAWTYIKSDYYRYAPFNGQSGTLAKAKVFAKMLATAFLAKEQGFTYSFWFQIGRAHV